MLDHISIGVTDLGASRDFCLAAFVVGPDGHNVEVVCHRQ
jgi:hypothetical protein